MCVSSGSSSLEGIAPGEDSSRPALLDGNKCHYWYQNASSALWLGVLFTLRANF